MTISRVLIANRGEIAVRIARGCRVYGVESVAVYSDADAHAPHVHAADHAVRIGPAPAAESYLHIERVIEAARTSGADAIHPGYGFLSENPEFVEACVTAGLVFIGPSADAMRALGDKSRAKAVAHSAGVPTVPTFDADAVPESAYPVLVKAAAGGGGRGMRIVRHPEDLDAAVAAAKREATAAFGSDEILVERLVQGGRHIEVQFVGDAHGNCIAVGDRDCSLQRRHQKVVEEAPAPLLAGTLRTSLADAATSLAREVGYVGAGTAEFLVTADGEWFFLEINARLQVEHPVTEIAFGIDLVEEQLRVADGLALSRAQDEIEQVGFAIEARLYAEDPVTLLPTGGRILELQLPSGSELRIDSGIAQGQDVSLAYDPLLAKIVARGASREQARTTLLEALRETAVLGVVTNGALLIHALELSQFVHATHTVETLEAHPLTASDVAPDAATVRAARRTVSGMPTDSNPFAVLGHWRGESIDTVDAPAADVAAVLSGDEIFASRDGVGFAVPRDHVEVPDSAGDATGSTHAVLTSPMPGTVLRIAEPGSSVSAGDAVVVLEAMKMENAISAPFDGHVAETRCAVGDLVAKGAVLAELAR